MRAAFASLLIVTGLTAAAPAAAQIVGKPDYGPVGRFNPFLPDSRPPGPSPAAEVRHLRERIGDAREAGLISAREARRLDREARLIGRLAWRYGRDGLSDPERSEIERRARVVQARINRPRR